MRLGLISITSLNILSILYYQNISHFLSKEIEKYFDQEIFLNNIVNCFVSSFKYVCQNVA